MSRLYFIVGVKPTEDWVTGLVPAMAPFRMTTIEILRALTLLLLDEDEKWHCYACDQKPLEKLQKHCDEIMEAVEVVAKRKKDQRAQAEERLDSFLPNPRKYLILTVQ